MDKQLERIALNAKSVYLAIQNWNVDHVKNYLIERENMSKEYTDAMEIEYKRFLSLILSMEPGVNIPISAEVDPFWHTHLLFTHDYTEMCFQFGGVYIHHVPAVSEEERDRLCVAYSDNTIALYEMAFGKPNLEFWPANAQICIACCDRPFPTEGVQEKVLHI